MESFDEAANIADGVIITARDGSLHYKYAKPYIRSGMAMLIDKPITVSEEEARSFAADLAHAGVKVMGGSSLKYHSAVCRLREERESSLGGATLGGTVSAPIIMSSQYGGFFFYAPHLVDIAIEIFGKPKSVAASSAGDKITVNFIYEGFSVLCTYTDNKHFYFAERITSLGVSGGEITVDSLSPYLLAQLSDFEKILSGKSQGTPISDLFFPVFVMNAISRSLKSGREEVIRRL